MLRAKQRVVRKLLPAGVISQGMCIGDVSYLTTNILAVIGESDV